MQARQSMLDGGRELVPESSSRALACFGRSNVDTLVLSRPRALTYSIIHSGIPLVSTARISSISRSPVDRLDLPSLTSSWHARRPTDRRLSDVWPVPLLRGEVHHAGGSLRARPPRRDWGRRRSPSARRTTASWQRVQRRSAEQGEQPRLRRSFTEWLRGRAGAVSRPAAARPAPGPSANSHALLSASPLDPPPSAASTAST